MFFSAEVSRFAIKPFSLRYSGSHNLLVWLNLRLLYRMFFAISSRFKHDLINFLIIHEFFLNKLLNDWTKLLVFLNNRRLPLCSFTYFLPKTTARTYTDGVLVQTCSPK